MAFFLFDKWIRPFGRQLALYLLILTLLALSCFCQYKIAVPNWNSPHYDLSGEAAIARIWATTAPARRIDFMFSLESFERTTSAAVYDETGAKVRTLWMNRAYERGEHRWVWDGKDDYGHGVPAGRYVIKVGYNNVTYTWDGLIGNTESSWSSYRTWDGIVPSFIRSLAFVNGKAYAADGYNEGGYAASVFDERFPNAQVDSLTDLVFSTLQHFMFAATDGKLIYFGFQTYSADRQPWQGVIAFRPSGAYYRFPRGASYPSFPKATATFWNDAAVPPTGIPDVHTVDMSAYPAAAVTGVAVEREGRLLATAHGFYQPGNHYAPVPSQDLVKLWDKSSGESLGQISIPNPHGMAFDLQNNLWIISGYGTNDVLYRFSGIGKPNPRKSPIANLSNPMSVAVSPQNGSIFVADGGLHQQVLEINPHTLNVVSIIGSEGGYISHGTCNATVSNTKFWLDPGPKPDEIQVIGNNSPFVSWVSVADNGDVWVGDFSTSRILHFARSGRSWKYIDRVMYLPWGNSTSAPLAEPTRIFGGPTGFLEFSVDYSKRLTAGDPEAADGNHSWQLVKNWLPCYMHADPSADLATQMSAYSFPNGKVIGAIFSDSSWNIHTLLDLEQDGLIKVKQITPLSGWTSFDELGNYYKAFVDNRTDSNKLVTFRKYAVASYDDAGFPNWYLFGRPIASYTADHGEGDPVPNEVRSTYWPSLNGIIPVLEREKNRDVHEGIPAFHLGGLRTGDSKILWMTMPEKTIPFTDGEGSFPAANVANMAHMGVNAWAMGDDIFSFQNGNGGPYSCQFYHFKDDGLFVGQFGFQTSPDYPPTNISWKVTGFPQKGTHQPLAPGECVDQNLVNGVRVGSDLYIYLGDESYHKGIHRWKVSNLESYGELSTAGPLGATGRLVLK